MTNEEVRNRIQNAIGVHDDLLTMVKPEDHWSCIAHLIAEDMLKSAVIVEKKFKNIECK